VSGQKKEKIRKKCPNWGKWVWPDESWVTVQYQTATFEKFS